ncbi:hypothetical protein, conserved, partial [Eimeria tenella]
TSIRLADLFATFHEPNHLSSRLTPAPSFPNELPSNHAPICSFHPTQITHTQRFSPNHTITLNLLLTTNHPLHPHQHNSRLNYALPERPKIEQHSSRRPLRNIPQTQPPLITANSCSFLSQRTAVQPRTHLLLPPNSNYPYATLLSQPHHHTHTSTNHQPSTPPSQTQLTPQLRTCCTPINNAYTPFVELSATFHKPNHLSSRLTPAPSFPNELPSNHAPICSFHPTQITHTQRFSPNHTITLNLLLTTNHPLHPHQHNSRLNYALPERPK